VSAARITSRLRAIDWRFISQHISQHVAGAISMTVPICGLFSLLGLVAHGFPEVYASLNLPPSPTSGIRNPWDMWWLDCFGGNALFHVLFLAGLLINRTSARMSDYLDQLQKADEDDAAPKADELVRGVQTYLLPVVLVTASLQYGVLVIPTIMALAWATAFALIDFGVGIGTQLRHWWTALRQPKQAA
jgi:hypothetical protein